jgi:hypothetical protein
MALSKTVSVAVIMSGVMLRGRIFNYYAECRYAECRTANKVKFLELKTRPRLCCFCPQLCNEFDHTTAYLQLLFFPVAKFKILSQPRCHDGNRSAAFCHVPFTT